MRERAGRSGGLLGRAIGVILGVSELPTVRTVLLRALVIINTCVLAPSLAVVLILVNEFVTLVENFFSGRVVSPPLERVAAASNLALLLLVWGLFEIVVRA